MRKPYRILSCALLAIPISLFLPGKSSILLAQSEAASDDEGRLRETEKAIDKEAVGGTQQTRSEALSKQFGVPVSTVDGLRGKNEGWGEISIQLAMAQNLVKTDPKTYPSMGDALSKIESLRNESKGWGKISKELNSKLGPVVSSAQHARQALAREAGPEAHPERGAGSSREKPEHPEHPDRPERPDRPEHGMQGERGRP